MFGLWFMEGNLKFSSIIARICASVLVIILILPLREISHIWLSHLFAGRKFNIKSYPFLSFFDPLGAFFMLVFGYGWPRRFPYFVEEPNNKTEYVLVYAIGPIFSFILSILLGIIRNLFMLFIVFNVYSTLWIIEFITYLIEINIILMVIDLLPVPPLDGFKICEAFIPKKFVSKYLEHRFVIGLVVSLLFLFGFFNGPLRILMGAIYSSVIKISNIPFIILKGIR